MKRGVTSTGFAYEYDEARLDDMRFVDVLAIAIDPNTEAFDKIHATSQLIEMMLGKEMKQALYEHIGKNHEGGRVPRADLEQALKEMMGAEDAKK